MDLASAKNRSQAAGLAGARSSRELTVATCSPGTRVTRSLLGYGALAGPFFVTISLAQAFSRAGFDPLRHPWSVLSNGDLGWLQITNFILTGLMVVAAAVGIGRALGPGWAPRLLGTFGASLVAAGVLRADPVVGFPAGTTTATISWHGIGHLIAGSIGFACLIAACVVLGRRFARKGQPGWAAWSRATGVVFLAAFVGIASGSSQPIVIVGFTAAVIAAFAWLAAVSLHLYATVAEG
jgi:hypothetical protein